jgi:phosphoglycolate phosphatase-like HAD superfamily hydrolase
VLVLWDIDHTLMETSGLGAELYRRAFERATGHPLEQAAEVTGQTETSILSASLRLHGIAGDEPFLSRYIDTLADEYERHRDELRIRGRALPGAREVLARLAGQPGIVQSVLTGNLRAVATTKLSVFELDGHLDLEVAAYADDSPDRPALVAIAQSRAGRKYATAFGPDNTVVIGDSVHDIATGRRGGARSIGVATGSSSIEELRRAGADAVVPGLDAVAAAVTRMLGAGGQPETGASGATARG